MLLLQSDFNFFVVVIVWNMFLHRIENCTALSQSESNIFFMYMVFVFFFLNLTEHGCVSNLHGLLISASGLFGKRLQ